MQTSLDKLLSEDQMSRGFLKNSKVISFLQAEFFSVDPFLDTMLFHCGPDLVHGPDRSIEGGSKISAKKPFHLKRIWDRIQLFEK